MSNIWAQNAGYIGIDADATGDPFWDACVLALRCDGTNGSTTFTDVSPAARGNATVSGSTAVSTSQSKFYGSSLNVPTGSGNFLSYADSADWNWDTDFIRDCWVYLNTTAGRQTLFSQYADGNNYNLMTLEGSGSLAMYSASGGVFQLQMQTVNSLVTTATWTHIRFSKIGGLYIIFVNGQPVMSLTSTASIADQAVVLRIGASDATGAGVNNGFLNDIRIYRGVGTASAFTPPSRPFMGRRLPSGIYTL